MHIERGKFGIICNNKYIIGLAGPYFICIKSIAMSFLDIAFIYLSMRSPFRKTRRVTCFCYPSHACTYRHTRSKEQVDLKQSLNSLLGSN